MKEVDEVKLEERLLKNFPHVEKYLTRNKHHIFREHHGEMTYFDWIIEETECWGPWKVERLAQNEDRRMRKMEAYEQTRETTDGYSYVDEIEEIGNIQEYRVQIKILIDEIWIRLSEEQQRLFAMILHENGLEHFTDGNVQFEIMKILDGMELRTDGQIYKYEKCKNLNCNIQSGRLLKIEESLYHTLYPILMEIN